VLHLSLAISVVQHDVSSNDHTIFRSLPDQQGSTGSSKAPVENTSSCKSSAVDTFTEQGQIYFLPDKPLAQRSGEKPGHIFWASGARALQKPSRAGQSDRAKKVEMRLERSGSIRKAEARKGFYRANLLLVSLLATRSLMRSIFAVAFSMRMVLRTKLDESIQTSSTASKRLWA
jgi:hypothetical protein